MAGPAGVHVPPAPGTAIDQASLSARDIAAYLGHADPSLTLGSYMSKTVGGGKAASALDAVMGRG